MTQEKYHGDYTYQDVEDAARAAHEANRILCFATGDKSQLSWDEAPEWQKTSAFDGVKHRIDNPSAPPEASHENWLRCKREDGWVYGAVKDPEKKTHPCLVEFNELPPDQQAKDSLFVLIVNSVLRIP